MEFLSLDMSCGSSYIEVFRFWFATKIPILFNLRIWRFLQRAATSPSHSSSLRLRYRVRHLELSASLKKYDCDEKGIDGASDIFE